MTLECSDDRGNNLIAAGAVFAALGISERMEGRLEVEIVYENEHATNRLRARFPFLKSPYIITIEREAEDVDSTTPGDAGQGG